ncbi:MAG: DUF190 domain-containing protein [Sulfurovum sp.]|nr:DUF190 domain-containing protein [Sulfurovum sp.]
MKQYLVNQKILRIYINDSDMIDGEPLWQYIMHKTQEQGLAGATVFKGVAGIGANSQMHTFEIWALSQQLPIVIEIIDDEDKIINFLNNNEDAIQEGLVTIQTLEVLRFKHKST